MFPNIFSSSPKAEDGDSENCKRTLSDTSILDNSTEQLSKKQASSQPTSSDLNDTKLMEQSLIRAMEAMCAKFSDRLDSSLLEFDTRLKHIFDRFEGIESRVSILEERNSSQQIVFQDFENKLADNEARLSSLEETNTSISDWEPAGSPNVNICLLGDSNSGGKLKFGEGKGKLGAALPGKDTFVATLDQLPDPEDAIFDNVSDLVIAVGTNDLKRDSSNPVSLAKSTYSYVKSFMTSHPATHVFLPGVLPTRSVDINARVREYNHYLKDMCSVLPRTSFIDCNNFSDKNGKLVSKYSVGQGDDLHLSQDGLKLYFSRFKFALRNRHSLPNVRRNRPTVASSNDRGSGETGQGARGGGRGTNRGGSRRGGISNS